jgi:hypothetical protein
MTPTKKLKFSFKASNNSLQNGLGNLNNINFDNYKTKEEAEYFDYEDEKKEELTTDEKFLYGNREPKSYKKIKLLGKYIFFTLEGVVE